MAERKTESHKDDSCQIRPRHPTPQKKGHGRALLIGLDRQGEKEINDLVVTNEGDQRRPASTLP